ncbi:lysophospholipase [Lactococcus sp.]|uniref:alpha/beta hydrolase n=1 Tax=Lactococcus sp. TaxID=44273 RepID=UPI0035B4957E
MKLQEQFIKANDGHDIRVGIFEPDTQAKGIVQLVHGFGEYIGHYVTVIDFFVGQGYTCVMHDQRGHGAYASKDPSQRGVSKAYDLFLEDLARVRDLIAQDFDSLPVYLMGHSMGGNIVLNFLLRQEENQQRYEKVIVESPWLDLAEQPPKMAQKIAAIIGKLNPKIRVHTGLRVDLIAHDVDMVKSVVDDGYFHDLLSLRLFTQIKEAGQFALAHAQNIHVPLLLLGAEEDGIVSIAAIRQFAATANPNITYLEIKGGYHALHIDTEAETTMKKILEFIQASEKIS